MLCASVQTVLKILLLYVPWLTVLNMHQFPITFHFSSKLNQKKHKNRIKNKNWLHINKSSIIMKCFRLSFQWKLDVLMMCFRRGLSTEPIFDKWSLLLYKSHVVFLNLKSSHNKFSAWGNNLTRSLWFNVFLCYANVIPAFCRLKTSTQRNLLGKH